MRTKCACVLDIKNQCVETRCVTHRMLSLTELRKILAPENQESRHPKINVEVVVPSKSGDDHEA